MSTATTSWVLIATIATMLTSLAADMQPIRPPNVVVILTDDQGWGDLSLNGNRNLTTPNIDSLAGEGAMFDRFYVCPVCSPTRAEFLTGRYHPRGGVYSTSEGGERLDLDETTIANTFKAAGYATGAFGKWHNGMQYPYHPNGRGFDEFYGFCSGHWGDYFSPPLEHNGRLVRGNGFVIDDFTDQAIAWMQKHRERPFFCYLPYNTPHSPMQVPDRFYQRFAGTTPALRHRDPEQEDLLHTLAALAMCENIDWNVGRVLAALDRLELVDETIVVFFCDNGPNGWRWNGEMRGKKGWTDEGGVRSPLLLRWPGHIGPSQSIKQPAAVIDLLPTLAGLAGIPLIGAQPLDGINLTPLLLGQTDHLPDRLVFSHWNSQVSVRDERYRLDHQGRLYDLWEDGGQRNDVSTQHPQRTARLRAAVVDWKREVLGELERGPKPFPLGHPDTLYTQLPARDGVPHGNIKRSNRWPNCSFFMNWTSLDDSITWDIEVPAPGRFEVELYYTCRPEDIGAVVALELNGETITTTIREAHDPPLYGAEHDRSGRGESPVKDFRSTNLGVMALPEGRGTLTLRALKKPGERVIDVRLLMFKRIVSPEEIPSS